MVFDDQDETYESPEKARNPVAPGDVSEKISLTPLQVISPFQAHEQVINELSQIQENKKEENESASDDKSDPKSHNSSCSESESDSESERSSEDSLDENEYNTKNPFILKYSKIIYKFHTYELKTLPPSVSDSTGKSEKLSSEMLFDLLYSFNNFDYDFFED